MKIRPKVFLKAAELIARGEEDCCCPALNYAGSTENEREFFQDLFKRDSEEYRKGSAYWWKPYERYSREARIIALLLAREIAKGGGL